MKTSTWFAGCAIAALVCTGALAQEQKGGGQTTQQETQQGAPQQQQKGAETPSSKGQAQGQQHKAEPNKQADQKKAQDQQPTQKGAQSKDHPNAAKSAETPKQDKSKSAETPKQDTSKSAETPKQDTSKSAETPKQDTSKSAETPKQDSSKSAETPKQDSSKSAETPRNDRQGTADNKSGSDKGAVQLSEKQRTDVHRDILKEKNVNRVKVNVQVRVGEHVPRNVKLAPLPATIISIVPAYRSYRYFVVDDRVVIIDPARYEIVEVIQPTGQVAGTSQHLTLTSQERDVVLREIDMKSSRSTLGIGALSEGAEVPRSVELVEFPADVVRKVTKLRSYKYFVAEQRVAIVEPSGGKIALVIDAK